MIWQGHGKQAASMCRHQRGMGSKSVSCSHWQTGWTAGYWGLGWPLVSISIFWVTLRFWLEEKDLITTTKLLSYWLWTASGQRTALRFPFRRSVFFLLTRSAIWDSFRSPSLLIWSLVAPLQYLHVLSIFWYSVTKLFVCFFLFFERERLNSVVFVDKAVNNDSRSVTMAHTGKFHCGVLLCFSIATHISWTR